MVKTLVFAESSVTALVELAKLRDLLFQVAHDLLLARLRKVQTSAYTLDGQSIPYIDNMEHRVVSRCTEPLVY